MTRPISFTSILVSIAPLLAACTHGSPSPAPASASASASASSTPAKPKAESAPPSDAAKPAAPHSDPASKAAAPAPTTTAAESDASADASPAGKDPAIKAVRQFIAQKGIDRKSPSWKTKVPQPPKLTFDPAHKYFWVLSTSEGPIKVRLMPDVAPMHVSSTIYLSELGFYDDTKFHRVIPKFMAQGGDPLGTGMGGPGYRYAGEFSPNASHSKPGILSTANAGPNTDGSQFFLTFQPTPDLDGKHTVFGEIVEGLENLKKIESFGSAGGPTSKLIKLETAKIVVE